MAALLLVPLLAAGNPAPPALLYSYDLTYILGLDAVSRFETVHTVAALGGLVNRDAPRLFTPLVTGNAIDGGSHADAAWRAYLTKPGEWLASTQWKNISSLEGLITTFQANISAVVLYDPLVPATSNLASTAAGVEGLLPVCFRPADPKSVYSRLVAGGPRLPVALNLTGRFLSTAAGPTPKIAAYRWARERWLTPTSVGPKANPAKLGYYADYWSALQGDRLKATPGLPEVANHDYFISQKAFFFDLSVWADEAPGANRTPPGPTYAFVRSAWKLTCWVLGCFEWQSTTRCSRWAMTKQSSWLSSRPATRPPKRAGTAALRCCTSAGSRPGGPTSV